MTVDFEVFFKESRVAVGAGLATNQNNQVLLYEVDEWDSGILAGLGVAGSIFIYYLISRLPKQPGLDSLGLLLKPCHSLSLLQLVNSNVMRR